MKILEILEQNEQRHLSAEDVYKALLEAGEDIGLATVYRVLTRSRPRVLVPPAPFRGRAFGFRCRRSHRAITNTSVRQMRPGVGRVVDEGSRKTPNRSRLADKAGYEMTDQAVYSIGVCGEEVVARKVDSSASQRILLGGTLCLSRPTTLCCIVTGVGRDPGFHEPARQCHWIPACAGMTGYAKRPVERPTIAHTHSSDVSFYFFTFFSSPSPWGAC
nr:transcriptional repressor [Thiohalobacter thiocyanaticus]